MANFREFLEKNTIFNEHPVHNMALHLHTLLGRTSSPHFRCFELSSAIKFALLRRTYIAVSSTQLYTLIQQYAHKYHTHIVSSLIQSSHTRTTQKIEYMHICG